MNPEQLLARLKALRESFSTWQLLSMAAAFVMVVVGLVVLTRWAGAPTYRLLFSDLDPESASQVVARLRDEKVSYDLVDGGRGVRVPEDRIDELRLTFAGQGMPAAGRIGFELFEGTSFGWTEFLEQVNYRRALEGELARTITTISDVAGARVHIAMGQKALFARERTPAKASVTLRLRGPRPLAPATVAGIRNLVAFAIEDLRPEAVVVIDDRGRPLAVGGDEADPGGPAQLEARNALEEQVARSIGAMLDPLVGADRYRVRVSAQLNHESQDVVAEVFSRDGALRSEERAVDASGGAAAAMGIAGARSNLPEPPAPGTNTPAVPAAAAPGAVPALAGQQSTRERRNFELDRTTTRTVRPRGGVVRLSVAVLVDNAIEIGTDANGGVTSVSKPRDPAFLQQVNELVSRAAGLDTARGDVLTVQNIAFEPVAGFVPETTPPGAMQRLGPVWLGLALTGMAAFGAGGFFLFRRRRHSPPAVAKATVATEVLPQQQLPRTIEEIEGEIAAQLDAEVAAKADRKMPVLTRRIAGLVQAEPEAAARLVRSWLVEEKKA